MKKFERLPLETRKAEIKAAGMELFIEKGFAETTMENIVSRVSLSKGGVYRIYPSTTAILSDLLIDGMHRRNRFYMERTKEILSKGEKIDLHFLIDIICDSLLIDSDVSMLYVEFLWEKRRNESLQMLYDSICETTMAETMQLIRTYGADEVLRIGNLSMHFLTDLMNTAILGLNVLDLRDSFEKNKKRISESLYCGLNHAISNQDGEL